MLVLTADEVERLLPVEAAIECVRQAFIAHSNGTIVSPQRLALPLNPPGAVLLSMPAYDGRHYAGVKVVAVQPANAARGLPVVRATYQLIDAATCEVLAWIDGTRLTALRTGAAGALAVSLLAPPGADTLAVIGSGAQAVQQVVATLAVRPVTDVWVYSRDPARVQAFIAHLAPRLPVRLHAAPSASDAVRRAVLVVTATNAAHPVIQDVDLAPGTHISAIGAFTPAMQELPDTTIARAAVYVDALEAAWEEAGDLLGPLHRGSIGRDHVRGEIGALALGRVPGRQSGDQITVFKSVGLAAQDLLCAAAVVQEAQARGLGTHVSL